MIPSRIWWLSAAAAAAVSLAVLSLASMQAPLPPAPPPAASNDPFGEVVTLVENTVVYISGSGVWDSAFETIVGGFKPVYDAMARQGLQARGSPMIIYTATDDTGFQFRAALPVAQVPTMPADSGLKVGKSPAGKALRFVHRGSHDSMDTTFELITNYLDEKQLKVRDVFVEQYIKDPITTSQDDLVIEVYIPLK